MAVGGRLRPRRHPGLHRRGSTTGGGSAVKGYGGKCVYVAAASSANGTKIQLYTCNGTNAQQWTIGSDGSIKAMGKCLDVTAANGTKVQLYDCNRTNAQNWIVGSDWTVKALANVLTRRA